MLLGTILLGCVQASNAADRKGKPYDVLMLCVDDLRTELSIYPEGNFMHTPNIERLAKRGVVFERAYVQVALCMPSRTSLLTSRRPDTSKSWTIESDQYWRVSGGNFTTLPQRFLQAGYTSVGMGKVFHEGPACAYQDYNISWSPEAIYPYKDFGEGKKGGLFDPPTGEGKNDPARLNISAGFGIVHKFNDTEEPRLQDGRVTDQGVRVIQDFAARRKNGSMDEPFFLAIGLHKPHSPWWGPKRFWDLYPIENVTLPPHPTIPTGVPAVALQAQQLSAWCKGGNGDCLDPCALSAWCGVSGTAPLSTRYPLDNTTIPHAAIKYMRQGYYATVSWTDANIGKILDAFEAHFDWNHAVVVFWGDHGYQLGDNDQWAKMTNFEHATRIPLIIVAPGIVAGRAPQLVEAIDIYPTLIEEAMRGIGDATSGGGGEFASSRAAGRGAGRGGSGSGSSGNGNDLPLAHMPTCPVSHASARKVEWCTEGTSLSPLLHATHQLSRTTTSWADAAYSQFPRPEHPDRYVDLDCFNKSLALGECPNKMGYTIRADTYRYTIWVGFDRPTGVPDWTTVYGVELYNHSASPVPKSYDMEHTNLAVTNEAAAAPVIASLHAKLKAFVSAGLQLPFTYPAASAM